MQDSQSLTPAKARIEWVDFAKGICIILVVMMHSTLGVEKAAGQVGYLSAFIEWARPFRMPDFFLISGLFLARRIDDSWKDYADKKVVHFAYFYVLWMTLQLLTKSYGLISAGGPLNLLGEYALGFIEPFGTLWFIYILALFFIVTKLTRKLPPLLIFVAAAALEIAPVHTGWLVIDEFAARFVYFFAGYWLAPKIFAATDILWTRHIAALLAMLYIWAMGHTLLVGSGLSHAPVISLMLGFSGACAVVILAIVLARSGKAAWLCSCGANSIVIYLGFFLPIAWWWRTAHPY